MVGGRGIAVAVGIIQRVGIAEHHHVGEGSAHHRLMVVVVERVFAGQLRQIGRVALGDVVEAHRDIAFLQQRGRRRVWRRIAVAAGGDRLLDPGEEIGLASARILPRDLRGVAVELLPHLVEAMHRAAAVSGIKAGGDLARLRLHQRIGAVRQVGGVQDAGVGRIPGDAGRAGRQQRQILRAQAVVAAGGLRQRGQAAWTIERGRFDGRVAVLGRVGRSGRLQAVGRVVVGRLLAGADRVKIVVHCRELRRPGVVRAGRSVLVDDSLGQQVVDMLAGARLVGREHMVESPVFADDDDDMLDGAGGSAVVVVGSAHRAVVERVGVGSHQ